MNIKVTPANPNFTVTDNVPHKGHLLVFNTHYAIRDYVTVMCPFSLTDAQ